MLRFRLGGGAAAATSSKRWRRIQKLLGTSGFHLAVVEFRRSGFPGQRVHGGRFGRCFYAFPNFRLAGRPGQTLLVLRNRLRLVNRSLSCRCCSLRLVRHPLCCRSSFLLISRELPRAAFGDSSSRCSLHCLLRSALCSLDFLGHCLSVASQCTRLHMPCAQRLSPNSLRLLPVKALPPSLHCHSIRIQCIRRRSSVMT